MTTTKIRVKHFHDGNDPRDKETQLAHTRGTAIYATRAQAVDVTTGVILGEAWAYCSHRDAASRAKGREIAVGRLERKLWIGRFAPSKASRKSIKQIVSSVAAKLVGTAL